MSEHKPRRDSQREREHQSNANSFVFPRPSSSLQHRTRSPGPSALFDSRSRSPQRQSARSPERPRSRQVSPHRSLRPSSQSSHPASVHSSRHPSQDGSRHSSAASTSHAHRDSEGFYYGSSVWSSQYGMHSAHASDYSMSSSAYNHQRNQRLAPHLYGDDALPDYTSASQHNRSPVLAPSYSSSRDSAWQAGSMPPPYRSATSRSNSLRGEAPRQMPPTRGPSHFYPGTRAERNYYIEKWRRGQ